MRKKQAQPVPAVPVASAATPTSVAAVIPGAGRRKRWFRLAALIGVPLVFLLAWEVALRLAGWGYPTCFFLKRQIEGRAELIDNQQFGKRFFPPGLVRYPRPFRMAAAKPADTLRIFVLGESAAMGDPEPKFGLPRMLALLLQERFPQRRIEVVNSAMVAINSHVVLPIARECAQQQGDLWIIYMGNNEMIGPYGSVGVFGSQAPPWPVVRASLVLKTTRLGQCLDAAIHALRRWNQPPLEWGGMTMMAEQKIRQDDPRTARVYRHFQRNLSDILEAGRRAGVSILLCTVATNLKDCAPFASLHRADLTAAELTEWESAYHQGVALESQGNLAAALECYQQAARIDGQFADLCFRLARGCLALGQTEEARRQFRAARDRDALQFRTDGRLNEIIRDLAATCARQGVRLVDAEELLAAKSGDGLAGENYFYEHVHLNPPGNYLLARSLAERAAETLGLRAENSGGIQPLEGAQDGRRTAEKSWSSAKGRDWLSEEECLRELGFTEWNQHDIYTRLLERIEQPPFTQQVNHTQHVQAVRQRIDRHRLAAKPAQVKRAAQQVAPIVASRPDDADLRWNLAQLLDLAGDNAGTEEQWRAVIRLQPQASLPYYNLGKVLDTQRRDAEAAPLYRQCLEVNPDFFEGRYALGLLLSRQERWADAARQLRQAVRLKPRAVEARLALGRALARAGQPAQAQQQYREVLRLDPDNSEAREHLETTSRS